MLDKIPGDLAAIFDRLKNKIIAVRDSDGDAGKLPLLCIEKSYLHR